MVRRAPQGRDPSSIAIAEKIVRLVNLVFGRRLAVSRALCDAVRAAIEDGYTEDEIRSVYWVSRTLPGEVWIKSAMNIDYDRGPVPPELALRHHGGINPVTGEPAKRWLDELLSRRYETNPQLLGVVLDSLPPEMAADERALLDRMGIPYTNLTKHHAQAH